MSGSVSSAAAGLLAEVGGASFDDDGFLGRDWAASVGAVLLAYVTGPAKEMRQPRSW